MLKWKESSRNTEALTDHDMLVAYAKGYQTAVQAVYSALKADPGDLTEAVALVEDQFIDDPEMENGKSH